MTSKELLYLSFGLKRGTEKLKVRNRNAEGLTVIKLRKTYFSPSNKASFFEFDFSSGPEVWTLEELTAVLLDSSSDTEILNVNRLHIVSNDEDKWIEVS